MAFAPGNTTSLSAFLRSHQAQILACWDEFAGTVRHEGGPLDHKALRDHAAEILVGIADDMDQPQSDLQQRSKSRGEAVETGGGADSAAETHADTRITSGFAIVPMMTEYRFLRASVLRLWADYGDGGRTDEVRQITRFNEAIDQAIIESVARYTEQTKQATDLFIGVLGHDIRNPLGTISVVGRNLVRSGRLDVEAAGPIFRSVERIRDVIEQVVDFTRAQAGMTMPIHTRPGDLAVQARDIVEETQLRHPEVRIELETVEPAFEGAWDNGRIGQLLSNLLGNAVVHGDRSQPIEVRLATARNGDADEVLLEVKNRGPVIPAADCLRIFEPLVRGAAVHGHRPEPMGLGLGLYICREIARAHGGNIEAKSDAAQGTRFIVHLPRGGQPAPAPAPAEG